MEEMDIRKRNEKKIKSRTLNLQYDLTVSEFGNQTHVKENKNSLMWLNIMYFVSDAQHNLSNRLQNRVRHMNECICKLIWNHETHTHTHTSLEVNLLKLDQIVI